MAFRRPCINTGIVYDVPTAGNTLGTKTTLQTKIEADNGNMSIRMGENPGELLVSNNNPNSKFISLAQAPDEIVIDNGGFGEVRIGNSDEIRIDETTNEVQVNGLLNAQSGANINGLVALYLGTPTGASAPIASAIGGTVVDVQARAALNALLAYLRTRGDVTP